MGTSASSKGPKGGVPLVPDWVPDPPADEDGDAPPEEESPNEPEEDAPQEDDDSDSKTDQQPHEEDPGLAPASRFGGARLALGRYGASGSKDELGKGLGRYTRKGLGGAGSAAKRLAGTAHAAGRLFDVVSGLRSDPAKTAADIGIDPTELKGRSAREIGDHISEAVCPSDGSQDAEARRDSISRAIADVAALSNDTDIASLEPAQIELLIERFVGYDICRRVELDVGPAVLSGAPNAAIGVRRLEEMKSYIQEKVKASFGLAREQGARLTSGSAASLTASVIRHVFDVFEDYIK